MSNIIRLYPQHKNTDEWLSMSNGGTSVFISVLVLSGSRMASNQREKELVVWLAEHDQGVVGIGTVGFDISEIPWTKENFKQEKDFMLKVIEGALSKIGWDMLSYTPNEEFIQYYLSKFKELIRDFEEQYIDSSSYTEWIELIDDESCGIPKGFPKCPIHDIFLHFGGCVVCNEAR